MTVSTAFPPSRVARGVAIKTEFKSLGGAGARFRPVRIGVIGQGAEAKTYSSEKRRVFSAGEVGDVFGYPSPLYQTMLSLLPPSGDGVGDISVTVYPLQQPASGGVQAGGLLLPSGTATRTQTYTAKIANVSSLGIVISPGDSLAVMLSKTTAAINGVLGMPGTATDTGTDVIFEVGWEGESGNDVVIEIEGPDDPEITWVVVQPSGGAGTVDVNPSGGGEGLSLIGNTWETHILNCLQYTDSTNLDKFADFNEGRWGPEVHKPFVVFTGCNVASVTTVTAVTDARATDRTNAILTNPGSNDLPMVIAADQLRRIARLANENPPHDYGSQDCPRLVPGSDEDQWDSPERQAAVLAGCSTVEVKDGVVNCSDIVTCYHPTGEIPPAYRYCVDIEKVSTMIYNTVLIFNRPKWDGAPLVPDNQAVKNPKAKKPKMALGALYALFDAAALQAIISDPDFAKENSSASIDSTNPKRLNVVEVFKVSGNANVISIDLGFGFYFGT